MSGSLTWNGDKIKAKLQEAQRLAIDETTGSCVGPAKDRVRIKTRILQGSIQFRPATREGSRTVGRWGSFDVNYALWQEIITFSRAGHQPYLRPAAEEEYPKLAARVRAYFRR
jgi:hypothetical protein